jgi:hypothetical protein
VPAVKRHIKYIRGNNINIKYTREIIYISKIKGEIIYILLRSLLYAISVKYVKR